MFARKVAVRLKPDSLRPFLDLMEREIVPWLRRQVGFLDLIILAAPDNSEVASLSFWDYEVNAQVFDSSGYPQVIEVLEELLDGVPYVKTFEVAISTFHGLTVEPSRPMATRLENLGSWPEKNIESLDHEF